MNSLDVLKGDITKTRVDAIVNAANNQLAGGGGVDGAIHAAGGEQIMKECKQIISKIGELETGKAVYTIAGNLPCSYVIHTVGPVYDSFKPEESKQLLRNAYQNALLKAIGLSCSSVAFPAISTGVYGYPPEEAGKIAFTAIQELLEIPKNEIAVTFVCFDEENYSIMLQQKDLNS